MTDSKCLYFIPLIDNALGSDNPALALMGAFKKIRDLGIAGEYKEGFAQFRIFMGKIVEAYVRDSADRERLIREDIHSLINDLVTDSFEGSEEEKYSLIEAFARNDKWRNEYKRIKSELIDFTEPQAPMGIEVLKDGQIIASLPIPKLPLDVTGVMPGLYTVRLSTGMVLWEGKLLKRHLFWLDAYGDEDLPMAAKTTEDKPKPTSSEALLGGDVMMDVVPDLQYGSMRFSRGKQRRS